MVGSAVEGHMQLSQRAAGGVLETGGDSVNDCLKERAEVEPQVCERGSPPSWTSAHRGAKRGPGRPWVSDLATASRTPGRNQHAVAQHCLPWHAAEQQNPLPKEMPRRTVGGGRSCLCDEILRAVNLILTEYSTEHLKNP